MIHSVIFDLDDTLCDYRSAKQRALSSVGDVLTQHSIDRDRFLKRYQSLEASLFRSFADGHITKSQYRVRRFEEVLKEVSETSDGLGAQLNQIYMSIANEQVQMFDDVSDTIEELKRRGQVCAVLTNGPSDGQRKKIDRCGLSILIDHIFISEELGAGKPAPECFLAAAEALGQKPSNIMMIGDSLVDDVYGAQAVGMTGVLVDRFDAYHNVNVPRIKLLGEIFTLLDKGSKNGD